MRPRLIMPAFVALVCLAAAAVLATVDDEPLALSERVWAAGEAPTSARPGRAHVIAGVGAFVDRIEDNLVRATPAEAERRLSDAGFVRAAAREYETAGGGAVSVAAQLRDSEAATAVLRWSTDDALSPCPGECNVDITEFDVRGIPGASGVRRVRTEGAPGAGPSDPFEVDEVSFVDGEVLYVLRTEGDPRTGDRDALVRAAKALHERVKGRSLP